MDRTATTEVAASTDRVWQTLADHEGMSTWGPGVKVTLERPGAEERNGLGAVRRVSLPGPMPAVVEEVTGFEPGRRLAYKALSGLPLRGYHAEVTLDPVAGGRTRVTYRVYADRRLPLADGLMLTAMAHALLRLLTRAATR